MTPRLLEQIHPLPGWMGAADPFGFDATTLSLANDARRYTQSTMSYVSMAGLVVAIEELLFGGELALRRSYSDTDISSAGTNSTFKLVNITTYEQADQIRVFWI